MLILRQQLKRVGTMITNLNRTCDEMRKEIYNAQRESAPMLEEASNLIEQKQGVETKQQLLDAFNEHFILSEGDLTILTNSTEPVNERFFEIMNRVKQVRKDCEVLLGTENQSLGMELMVSSSES
jgi:conserved oligomeric Golgi complex subunit 6